MMLARMKLARMVIDVTEIILSARAIQTKLARMGRVRACLCARGGSWRGRFALVGGRLGPQICHISQNP